jgi:hypothetical protein
MERSIPSVSLKGKYARPFAKGRVFFDLQSGRRSSNHFAKIDIVCRKFLYAVPRHAKFA